MIDERTFVDIAGATLGAALEPHGYQQTNVDGFRVRYEKPASYLEVTYDAARSHEVSIWLADSQGASEPPLELSDALRVTDCSPEDVRFVELIQTSDADVLGRLMERVSAVLRRCASGFLEGRRDAYTAARRLRSERAALYTAELHNRGALEAADAAWTEKDYGRVHDLLNPIRDSLDESHRRRLTFAEKRLQ